MAEINRVINGRPFDTFFQTWDPVVDSLKPYAFEIEATAEVFLAATPTHAPPGQRSFVRSYEAGTEWAVELNDERGDKGALNIERGRGSQGVDENGIPYGSMRGLFILERAVEVVAGRHRSELR